MSAVNWKHWLLQHERAARSLEKNSLRIAARLNRLPAVRLVAVGGA